VDTLSREQINPRRYSKNRSGTQGRFLVFSQFTSFLDIVRKRSGQQMGIVYEYLTARQATARSGYRAGSERSGLQAVHVR